MPDRATAPVRPSRTTLGLKRRDFILFVVSPGFSILLRERHGGSRTKMEFEGGGGLCFVRDSQRPSS